MAMVSPVEEISTIGMTVHQIVERIFIEAIKHRTNIFVLVGGVDNITVVHFLNKNGHVEVITQKILVRGHHGLDCLNCIKVNSGIDPAMPRGIEVFHRKDIKYQTGGFDSLMDLICIPAEVVGNEFLVVRIH
ncbi:MAG: hypothetical protein PHN69_01715 [Candidatus Pacebacteria bacterium]|nr:hypothetical protein [Candidatus Paceibacterota bacterium]